jgi:hypothetical protein
MGRVVVCREMRHLFYAVAFIPPRLAIIYTFNQGVATLRYDFSNRNFVRNDRTRFARTCSACQITLTWRIFITAALKNPGFILLLLFATTTTVHAQVTDYKLQAGFGIGYRFVDMADVNYIYAKLGFGPIVPSKPGDTYTNIGVLKPYNGTIVYGGYIHYKPLKNNPFTLTLQYDYMPEVTRSEITTNTYFDENTDGKITDTVTSLVHSNTNLKIQTSSLVFGYDFLVKKCVLNLGLGATYNTFRIAGDLQQTYVSRKLARMYFSPIFYPDKYRVYGTAKGLGFLVQFGCTYPIYKRWSANFKFQAHAAELPIDDVFYNNHPWYQRDIVVDDDITIHFVHYFSAQFSGAEFSGGIRYSIF